MEELRKRKHLKSEVQEPEIKAAKLTSRLTRSIKEPFPDYPRPTADECRTVRDDLLAFHGFPQEFAKYRRNRPTDNSLSDGNGSAIVSCESQEASPSEALDSKEESVLDGLVRTVLSQNTTEVNSQRAFDSLKSAFPTWEDVLNANSKNIENAIRCGGLAPTKAACIKNILRHLLERKGKLCLEYLRCLSVDEVKAELSHFRGIGPKTVACVLMFQLRQDDFPVDTHVFEIAKAVGWIPAAADRNKAYLHLNQRIPNDLKFDLNCLLFTHGKICRRCTRKGSPQIRNELHDDSCPLLSYSQNS